MLMKQTPEEFCENIGKNTLLENSYTYARVNEKGNLILILNDEELQMWKNKMLDNPMRKSMKKVDGYKLSEDNTKFTAKCYRETAIDLSIACGACATESIFLQILDKKDYDSIKFEGFFIDAVTNETKYHLVFKPGKSFKTNFNAKKFSSIDDVE